MNKFAERLKELREEKNLTQYELSKKVNISTACINRWEKNLRVPNIDSIIILCQFFGCSADYLIGLEDAQEFDLVMKEYYNMVNINEK